MHIPNFSNMRFWFMIYYILTWSHFHGKEIDSGMEVTNYKCEI